MKPINCLLLSFGITITFASILAFSLQSFASPLEQGYKLPWDYGVTREVKQGWNTEKSHTCPGTNCNAYDFQFSEGESVLASHKGIVSHTVKDKTLCGASAFKNDANYVVIAHEDGTSTTYLHLLKVLVDVGDRVSKGQLIGYSGKTGWTKFNPEATACYPHLHFTRQFQDSNRAITNTVPIYFDEYPGEQFSYQDKKVSKNIRPLINLFDLPNYDISGSSYSIFNPGSFELSILDNRVSSIQLPADSYWNVEVFEQANFQGHHQFFYSSDPDLRDNFFEGTDITIDGRISSVKIYDENSCQIASSGLPRTQPSWTDDQCIQPTPTSNSGGATPTPLTTPYSDLEVLEINSPSSVNPNQTFIPEITIRLGNGQQLLESRGDMLRHYSGTNYSNFPHIGVVGAVNSGQTYTFRFYDGYPFVAPSQNGDYESVWRVWADGQWVGPEIPIRFTVGTQATPTPDWLLGHSESTVVQYSEYKFSANISNVAKRAFRICVNNSQCAEISGGNTYAELLWDGIGASGEQTISYELDPPGTDSWDDAYRFEHTVDIGTPPVGLAKCDSGEGAYLRSGDKCIRLTQSFPSLVDISWSNLEMTVEVVGTFNAWTYDGVNYAGPAKVVQAGTTQPVGSHTASIRFMPSSVSFPLPSAAFACDANTYALYRLDESGYGVTDSCNARNGTNHVPNLTVGKFGGAQRFNGGDEQKIHLGTHNITCPFTVDFWFRRSEYHDGALISQLGGNGNTGPNKWLLSITADRVSAQYWYDNGGQNTASNIMVRDQDWHYVMATNECAGATNLYVDNKLVGTFDTLGTTSGGATTLEIGSAESRNGFYGDIDEVRISTIIRSPDNLGPLAPNVTPTPLPVIECPPTGTTANWESVPSGMYDISVGNQCETWGISDSYAVHRWNGSEWIPKVSPTGKTLRYISVGTATNIWAVDSQKGVWKLRNDGTGWISVTSGLATLDKVAAGENNEVWGLLDKNLYQWNGTAWEYRKNLDTAELAISNDHLWALSVTGYLYKWDNDLVYVANGIQHITAGGPLVCAQTDAGQINCTENNWATQYTHPAPPNIFKHITVNSAGSFWGIEQSNVVRRWIQGNTPPTPTASPSFTPTMTATDTPMPANTPTVTPTPTGTNPPVPAVYVVDYGDPGYSETGEWRSSTWESTYYGADYRYEYPNDGSYKSVTYRPHIEQAGKYQVLLKRIPYQTFATNVPIEVHNADGVYAKSINQREAGSDWILLGCFNFSVGDSGYVILTTQQTDGLVVADAVKFQQSQCADAEIPPTQYIVDYGDAEYSEQGLWYSSTWLSSYFRENYRYSSPNYEPGTTKTATYRPNVQKAGPYRLYMRGNYYNTLATNVAVKINHVHGQSSISVNQQPNAGIWKYLGCYEFGVGNQGTVVIDVAGANGLVVADALAFTYGGCVAASSVENTENVSTIYVPFVSR